MTISWQIQCFGELGSTQDMVMHNAQEGGEEGLAIQALTQSSGRGRHGNAWEAPMGNLYLSFLLKPDYDFQAAGQVSFVVALAVAKTIQSYTGDEHKIEVKWPNDVMVNGQKISGILLESDVRNNKLESLVVGVGVNIFNKPEGAICLNDIVADQLAVNKVRDTLLENFANIYMQWQEKGFTPIRDQWLAQAYKLNEEITARLPDQSFHGIFKTIDETGALVLLESNDNERVIHAAEIYFGENA